MYKSKYLEKAKQRLVHDATYPPIKQIDQRFKVDVSPGGDNMLRDADGKPVKAQYINSAQIYCSGMALRGYEK